MNILKTIYYRTFQKILYLAAFFLPWREPILLKGPGKLTELPEFIKSKDLHTVLIVTDNGLMQIGLLNPLLKKLTEVQINYVLYDKVVPNPTIDNIEDCVTHYRNNKCQAIIAMGGGSPIDCAKVAGARIASPNKPIPKMKGMLRIRHKLPPLFAVPTTAGTGSETTLAAVVTDPRTHHKYAINDPALIPYGAVLDPELTVKLPQHITSTTGMDALCHAVEAYIGKANTKKTKAAAIKAIKLIFENVVKVYEDGTNLEARENMQTASYLAGVAFTRAYVGWVHAIAHTLGGFYQVPHGLANAVIMPYVFRSYGNKAHKKLAELADLVGLTGDNTGSKAEAFIKAIESLNQQMNIPTSFPQIKEEALNQMVRFAELEANPWYPTPKILSREEVRNIYRSIKNESNLL